MSLVLNWHNNKNKLLDIFNPQSFREKWWEFSKVRRDWSALQLLKGKIWEQKIVILWSYGALKQHLLAASFEYCIKSWFRPFQVINSSTLGGCLKCWQMAVLGWLRMGGRICARIRILLEIEANYGRYPSNMKQILAKMECQLHSHNGKCWLLFLKWL